MLQYIKPYRIYAVMTIAFMIGEVLVDLYQPRLMESIVNEGVLGLNHGGVPDLPLVAQTGLSMVLIVLLGGFCGVMGAICVNFCAQNFGNDIRKDCFQRIMHLSMEQIDAFRTGSLITRITSDTTQVQTMVSAALRGVVRSLTFLIAGTAALLTLDIHFSMIAALAVPVILIEVAVVVWRSSPLFLLVQQKIDVLNNVMQEDIQGARVIKSYGQEARENERFGVANDDLAAAQLRVLLLIACLLPLVNIVLNIALIAVIYIGSFDVQAGMVGPGTVMAALTYIVLILNGILMFAMIMQIFARGMTSKRRLEEVLATQPAIVDGGEGSKASGPGKTAAIELCHVSFCYPSQQENVLTDISLAVARGETLAIVGATGSGKSTLLALLPRFYDATAGEVFVDGVDVRTYALRALRQKMAIVLQKTELFSMTIGENIAWGMDATVSWGGPDYKFTNNTLYPVKIVAKYEKGYLTVQILGTNVDGTYVKMSNEVLSKTPWETIYQEDPTMAPGSPDVVKVTPYTGYKVNSYQTIYDKDGKVIDSHFEASSNYKVRNKVILQAPAAQPGSGTAEIPAVTPDTPSDTPVPMEPTVPAEPAASPDLPVEPEIPAEP